LEWALQTGVVDEAMDFGVPLRNLGDKGRYGFDVTSVEDVMSCGTDLGCGGLEFGFCAPGYDDGFVHRYKGFCGCHISITRRLPVQVLKVLRKVDQTNNHGTSQAKPPPVTRAHCNERVDTGAGILMANEGSATETGEQAVAQSYAE
jgi:hypothetical protein